MYLFSVHVCLCDGTRVPWPSVCGGQKATYGGVGFLSVLGRSWERKSSSQKVFLQTTKSCQLSVLFLVIVGDFVMEPGAQGNFPALSSQTWDYYNYESSKQAFICVFNASP